MAIITNPVFDGMTLDYSVDGTTFQTFGVLFSLNGNKITAPEVSTASLASTAMPSQPGVPDYGEFTAEIYWAAAQVTLVNGWVAAKTKQLWWKVSIPDGTTKSTDTKIGWVKEFDPIGSAKLNEEIITSITVKVVAAPTFTAGS
jgi:hypothetical protein